MRRARLERADPVWADPVLAGGEGKPGDREPGHGEATIATKTMTRM